MIQRMKMTNEEYNEDELDGPKAVETDVDV